MAFTKKFKLRGNSPRINKLRRELTTLVNKDRTNRNQILDWGTEAFNDLVNSHLPCIHSFFNAWLLFKTCFHQKSPTTHNNLLHSPLFLNPWILRKPEVADYFTYKWKVNKKSYIDPQDYGLPRKEFGHLKILDLLDKDGIKPLD